VDLLLIQVRMTVNRAVLEQLEQFDLGACAVWLQQIVFAVTTRVRATILLSRINFPPHSFINSCALIFSFVTGLASHMKYWRCLARRGLNVVAVEVDPPHIYIDSPELLEYMLPALQEDCQKVDGVGQIEVIDVLPGIRRRLHLDTMMAVMEDPVLAVDGSGNLVIANAAAAAVAGMDEAALCRLTLSQVLDDAALQEELIANGFRIPSREVSCTASLSLWM
jgi:PAS domain-containing protein